MTVEIKNRFLFWVTFPFVAIGIVIVAALFGYDDDPMDD